MVAGLVFLSVSFSFIMKGNGFPWGGGFGDNISRALVQSIGWIGTAALLSVVGLAYIIWRFNPVFTVPKLPERKNTLSNAGAETDDDRETGEAALFIETPVTNGKGNSLKKGAGLVIPPKDTDPEFELKLTEKESNDFSAENDFGNPALVNPEAALFVPPVKPEKKEKKATGGRCFV